MTDRENRKRILIFGDSNTWGWDPQTEDQRHDRFVERLRSDCPEYEILEEGMNGRVLDAPGYLGPESGSASIRKAIGRNLPLDLIVIALGSNDARRMYSPSIRVWKADLDAFLNALNAARTLCPHTPVLLVSPPLLNAEAIDREMLSTFSQSGQRILEQAQSEIQKAGEEICFYTLISSEIGLYGGGYDGIHLDASGHLRLAKALEEKFHTIFADSK